MPSLFSPAMTVTKMLEVAWVSELSALDFELVEEIREGIDFEHIEGLLPDSSIGSASKRKLGWFLHPGF